MPSVTRIINHLRHNHGLDYAVEFERLVRERPVAWAWAASDTSHLNDFMNEVQRNVETQRAVRAGPPVPVPTTTGPSTWSTQTQPAVDDSLYRMRDALLRDVAAQQGVSQAVVEREFPPPYRADIMRVVKAPQPPGDLHWLGVIGKAFVLLAQDDRVVRGWQMEL